MEKIIAGLTLIEIGTTLLGTAVKRTSVMQSTMMVNVVHQKILVG